MQNKATASNLYFKILFRIFEALDIDKEAFKRSIKFKEITRTTPRSSAQSVAATWNAAAQYSGHSDFGLLSGQLMSPTDYGILSYVLLNCKDGTQMLGLICRFKTLLSNSYLATLYFDGEFYKYSLSDTLENNEQLIEFDFASIIHLGDKMVGSNAINKIRPTSISFQHKNISPIERYEEVFNCPVKFNQAHNYMLIHKSVLETPQRSSNQHAKALLLKAVEQVVSVELSYGIEENIRLYVRAKIEDKQRPTLNETAIHFGYSPSTFKRALAKIDLTYKKILDEVLMECAQKLLKAEILTITDIAVDLGFSSSSSFVRFYKRVAGKSPIK